MRFVRESTFPARSSIGGVDFYPTPFGDLAGPLVDAPAGFTPYPDLPSVSLAAPDRVRRFLVMPGERCGVGRRLAVHDRCAPIRFASDDGSGPLNPVPVDTMASAAHLIEGRLAVASTPPATPPPGGGDGAAGPDVDAPGSDDASPAASVPGMVDEQSRPGGPTQEQLASLRKWAEAMDQRDCSCGGNGWVEDECWSAYADGPPAKERVRGDGLVPCGFCNFGGWDHDPAEPVEPWDVPVTILALLEAVGS